MGKKQLSREVLEDTYLRIVEKQGKIRISEAEELLVNLRGKEGFVSTLRKVSSGNTAQASGHLHELFIANHAQARGLRVVAIGKKFNDGIKRGLTDIDLVVKNKKTTIPVEAKHYEATTEIPLDKFRADMDTLNVFCKSQGGKCTPVFTLRNKPANDVSANILEKEATRRKIELIYGSPEEVSTQLKVLSEVP